MADKTYWKIKFHK